MPQIIRSGRLPPGQPSGVQLANASTASLVIDPVNGSANGPTFRTAQQLALAVGAFTSCEVNVGMTVSILGTTPYSDPFVIPRVGNSGSLLVTGSPGATTLATGAGGFTVSVAADPSAGVNEGQTLTDTGLSTSWTVGGPGGTSLISKRIRITSGTHNGTICWSMKDQGSFTARCTKPAVGTISLPASGVLTLSSITASSADPYVIESLPTISVLVPDGYAEYDGAGSTLFFRLAFEGVKLASISSTPRSFNWIPRLGGQGALFVGCDIGSLGGWYQARACFVDNLYSYPGDYVILKACGMRATTDTNVTVRGQIRFDQGTLLQSTRVLTAVSGNIEWFDGAVFDASANGIQIGPGSTLDVSGPLYGKGNTTNGCNVRTPGAVVGISGGTPTLTGNSGTEVLIGATATTWAAVVAASTTVNGSTVGPKV